MNLGNCEEEALPVASPTFSLDWARLTGSRVLRCDYEDWLEVAGELIGDTRRIGSTQNWHFQVGHILPNITGLDLVATAIRAEPIGKSSQASTFGGAHVEYDKARLYVDYEVAPSDNLELLVEETMERSMEFVTQPHRKLYWDSAHTIPLNSDEAPGKILPFVDWTYKIKRIPFIPENILAHQGKVNSSAVTSIIYGGTFAAETVLYENHEIERRTNYRGNLEYDIAFHYKINDFEWNKFFRAGENEPQALYESGSGTAWNLYDVADLRGFFVTES